MGAFQKTLTSCGAPRYVFPRSCSTAPQPPAIDAAIEKTRAHFVDHASGIRASGLLQALVGVALLLFVCWLSAIAGRESRSGVLPIAVLAGGLVTLAATLTGAAVTTTLAFGVADNADAGLLQALFRLSDLALDVGDPMLAVMVATFTAGIWQAIWGHGGSHSSGFTVAAAWTIGTVAVVATSGLFAGVTGPWGMAMILLLLVWIGCMAVVGRRAPLDTAGARHCAWPGEGASRGRLCLPSSVMSIVTPRVAKSARADSARGCHLSSVG